ncbi:MAG TPA: response regulator transcription factor [Candidatus Binatia bacterium]|nr:response regulator transcription factor [Candidatus Binatia bacterium]
MPEQKPVRVLVVDDHRAVAESIAMAIDLQPDMRCVGIASTIAEARAVLLTTGPDVLLTDVQLPDGDGVEAARKLLELHPDLNILVLTAHSDIDVLARAAAVGVSGILPKESGISSVLTAIRKAGEGSMAIEGSVLSALLSRAQAAASPAPGRSLSLTDREMEVLGLLSEGLDPQGIARRLEISVHTCRGHVKSILAKLDAHSQLEAVITAMRLGLVPERGWRK